MQTNPEMKRKRRLLTRPALTSLQSMNLSIVIPATAFGCILFGCFFIPEIFSLSDPNHQVLEDARLAPGTPGHILGTDGLGRDVLSRVLHGGRVSLTIGFGTVAIGLLIGGGLGVLAGYFGGFLDTLIGRFVDILLAFPVLVLALAITSFLGPSVGNVILAISCYTIPAYVRIARSSTLTVRQRDFILAARLAGAKPHYIIVNHIAPIVARTLMAYGLLAVGTVILVESALSFLGLGVRPPQATWGSMLADGKVELQTAAHVVFAPAIFLFLSVVLLNLLGDSLRRRSDRRVGSA